MLSLFFFSQKEEGKIRRSKKKKLLYSPSDLSFVTYNLVRVIDHQAPLTVLFPICGPVCRQFIFFIHTTEANVDQNSFPRKSHSSHIEMEADNTTYPPAPQQELKSAIPPPPFLVDLFRCLLEYRHSYLPDPAKQKIEWHKAMAVKMGFLQVC